MKTDELLVEPRIRVAWVDIARVITMLGTMLTHSPISMGFLRVMWFTSSGRMSLLFVVAGYFMAKKCPEGIYFPQIKRAWRMLAAYGILIVLYVSILGGSSFWQWQDLSPLGSGDSSALFSLIRGLLGIGELPPGPFWFLRDLFLLTLMCGFFAMLQRRKTLWILVIALLGFSQELACNHFRIAGFQTIHPREIAFFALGFCLANFPLSHIGAALYKHGIAICTLGIGLIIYEALGENIYHPSSIAIIFYMMITCVLAIFIEKHWKWLAGKIAPMGESVFLVYVLHMLVISLLIIVYRAILGNDKAAIPSWIWPCIVPLIYIGIHKIGMLIKRFSPTLFDILAIRPPKP